MRTRRLITLCLLLLVAISTSTEAQTLKFAPVIYNVSALTRSLSNPEAIAVDPQGNVYVADTNHNVVRKVDLTSTAVIFAGTGSPANTGDGGPADQATLNHPSAVAVDQAGNVFVADQSNYSIRRIDAITNIITTVAGGNGSAYTGDGGPATSAALQFPSGLAVDLAGNLYIADQLSKVVRKVDTFGIITTIAGGGTPASGIGDGGPATSAQLTQPFGLAVDASNNLYIADGGASLVRKVDATGVITTFAGSTYGYSGDGGLATSAKLGAPRGLAVDTAGNVFIADAGDGYVRKVDANNIITTFAGAANTSNVNDGTPAAMAYFGLPSGVAVDGSGNVYTVSANANAAYKIVQHPEQFPLTKVGLSSAPQRLIVLNTASSGTNPIHISAVTATGDFQVLTLQNDTVAYPQPCNSVFGTVYPGFNGYCTIDVVFTPTAAGIRSFPLTVTSDDSPTTLTTTLSSTGLSSTLSMNDGLIFTVAGIGGNTVTMDRGDGGPATAASLGDIGGIVFDSAGNIIFDEYPLCQIRKIDAQTGIITTIAGVNPFTCDRDNAAGGTNLPDGIPATTAKLYGPTALVFKPTTGELYLSDALHGMIRRIDTAGNIYTVSGDPLHKCYFTGDGGPAISATMCGASGMAFDGAGNFYFTDSGTHVIRTINPAGNISTVAGVFNNFTGGYSGNNLPALSTKLNSPWGLVVDASGNLFFVDRGNSLIRKLDMTTHIVSNIAGQQGVLGYSGDGGLAINATFNDPNGLAIDTAGNLYVADSTNSVIRKIEASTGIITTVAGNFLAGSLYNGDGIPATSAGLNFPETVAIDPAGYLLLGDRDTRLRMVSPNGSLTFGPQQVGTLSAALTTTISNIGNTPMHFSSSMPYTVAGDFAYTAGGTCDFTQPLAVGSSCTVTVTFSPTAVGTRYGTLAFNNDGIGSPQYVLLRGTGTKPAGPKDQTIRFGFGASVVYGHDSITLTATATSGLPVTLSVLSGPGTMNGNVLSITGVGVITMAANQPGDADYNPAPQVTTTATVTPALLTVTAANASFTAGQPLPAFTSTLTGFVYSDTSAVVTGAPALSTPATSSSPAGSYAINASLGTLAAANYTFAFVPGTLTVAAARQTITFSIADHVYGAAAFAVSATASSGLPVTYAIQSGPATINGSTIALTGSGVVTVTASQAGDPSNNPVSTNATFNVAKATLNVAAQNASQSYGQALPTFTSAVTGFVYNDTAVVVTGSAALSSGATASSPVGTYPITATLGSLAAANYTFTFTPAILTIGTARLAVSVNPATRTYGVANPTFTGSVNGLQNGDLVTVTYATNAILSSAPGMYPITTTVSGASAANYNPVVVGANLTVTQAPVSVTLTPASLAINVNTSLVLTATVSTAVTGTPTGSVVFLDGSTQVGAGTIAGGVATATLAQLSGGIHHLTAQYGGDTNFTAGASPQVTETVGDYTFAGAPVTVKQGASGTTTITLTPTNGFRGSFTPTCTGLPVGAACTFSPATITADGSNTPSTTTLTISTTGPVTTRSSLVTPIGFLGTLISLWMLTRIRRKATSLLLLLAVTVGLILPIGLTGCGSASTPTQPVVTPLGQSNISISFAGSDAAHQLTITLTVD
jgi:sugar lactone lactonase YvrE